MGEGLVLGRVRPSEATRTRVGKLVAKEKSGALTPEETSELEHDLQLEHIMRLAKTKQYLSRS